MVWDPRALTSQMLCCFQSMQKAFFHIFSISCSSSRREECDPGAGHPLSVWEHLSGFLMEHIKLELILTPPAATFLCLFLCQILMSVSWTEWCVGTAAVLTLMAASSVSAMLALKSPLMARTVLVSYFLMCLGEVGTELRLCPPWGSVVTLICAALHSSLGQSAS